MQFRKKFELAVIHKNFMRITTFFFRLISVKMSYNKELENFGDMANSVAMNKKKISRQRKGNKKEAVEAGARIRKCRENLGMTQEQFAEKIGVTAAYVSRLESGKYLVSSKLLIQMHEALDIDPGYILIGIAKNEMDLRMQRFVNWYNEIKDGNEKQRAGKFCESMMDFMKQDGSL